MRTIGSGIVPGETWVYRNGAVSKIPRGEKKPLTSNP
jgi:hypothetical protein